MRVRITGAGRQEIAAVRAGLQQLRTSGLDILAVQAKVDEYAARLLSVLRNEVVPIGRPVASTTTTAVASSASTTTTAGPVSTSSSSSTTTSAPVTTTTTTTTQAP
jgi:hypothetical protein